MLYDLITHIPPPSHLALSPFDLYREPMAVIALADGKELQDTAFSKRHSANGTGPTVVEKNVRALYQELEDLRDDYPKALIHRVLIFDYVAPTGSEIPMPEDLVIIPPVEQCKRTTMKTAMCDISSRLLAEMTTLAKSFDAMTAIESPGHYSIARQMNGWADEDGPSSAGISRRNSQFVLPQHLARSNSATGIPDKAIARMSMPPVSSRPQVGSSNSTPARPSTPVKPGNSNAPPSSDGLQSGPSSGPGSPEPKQGRHDIVEGLKDMSRDRVSVQGFGPGGANDRWRLKGKGRSSVVIGSMYLQAGRWGDSLRELSEGATAARSLNDHIWHGKALELMLMNMFLLAWSGLDFQIPITCFSAQERPTSFPSGKPEPENTDPSQPKHIRNLQSILPDFLERILGLYSRISAENLPPLPLSETTIRFSKILTALHVGGGKLNKQSLDMIVTGQGLSKELTTSPRLTITPTRQHIANFLFKAFPSSNTELLTTADRVAILSGIAGVLGPLGYHRKKAMVIRELVSVLIGGLVEARTRGAAEAGVHPAAGLVSLAPGNSKSNGAVALDLGEGDIEKGIEAFLELLCKSYGITSFDRTKSPQPTAESVDIRESDEVVFARIRSQVSTRFFGFPSIKLNILRACINFSEALPDFNGVLKFSSDLMRTGGSGIAPGPRREDASPMIHRDEQARLVTNIARTSSLIQKLGMSHLTAEYWDEFLVRAIKLESSPNSRTPIAHARSVLPGATATRASQDVNPFIYNPFLKEPDEASAANLVAGELTNFKVTLQNTYDIELDIESIRLQTEGVAFESMTEATIVGPYRTQALVIQGRAKEPGSIKVIGAIVKVRGCRERRFTILPKPWNPSREEKIKTKGIDSLSFDDSLIKPRELPLQPYTLSLNVVQPLPVLKVKSTTLPQSSVMILEGERQVFSVTLQNLSTTPVDFILFSFKDSTQAPLQAALENRDATLTELYEYELILMKKQALRLPGSDRGRNIAPGGEATFEFEILGKPGLTQATIQVDYTYLGVPRDEVTEQFYTRQVSVDMTVTVNASVELARIDTTPMHGLAPQPLWDRLGGVDPAAPDEFCLLSMDLRNAWPSQMAVCIESANGFAVNEHILPGKTCRLIIPIRRAYLDDPHASIPTLNPSRNRQFVVSTSKISPEMERANREAFWYRERILDDIKATWRTTSVPIRKGVVELRNMRLSTRMIETIKVPEVGVQVSVEDLGKSSAIAGNVAYVDEFMQLRAHITNRTTRPISPLVRILPALCHRPLNVALDYTRKFAWNGTLQQLLPELKGGESTDFIIGVTALCRGEFEITASVEEVYVWEDAAGKQEDVRDRQRRARSDTQRMIDAALGVKERRVWHSRQSCMLRVRDRE